MSFSIIGGFRLLHLFPGNSWWTNMIHYNSLSYREWKDWQNRVRPPKIHIISWCSIECCILSPSVQNLPKKLPVTNPNENHERQRTHAKAAKGGVLFIDEAYELGKGPFGAEACTSIVAAMTDPKYRGGTQGHSESSLAFWMGNTAIHYNSVVFQCSPKNFFWCVLGYLILNTCWACFAIEEAVVVSQLSLVSGVVIIMAGYPGDMNKMLDTNPGLKSRFTHFIEFEDWSPEDCLHLFRKRAT